jgi:hypothetical protein
MDVALTQPNSENLVFCISKSTNAHIIAFYWQNDSVETQWLLRRNGPSVDSVEPLTLVQSLAMGLSVSEAADGRLEVASNMPFKRKLFLAQLKPGTFGLVFDGPTGISQLQEAFVDVASSSCVCKCIDLATSKLFTETVDVEIAAFL